MKRWGIQQKLLAISLVILTPVVGYTAYLFLQRLQATKARSAEIVQDTARQAARELEHVIGTTERLLTLLSTHPDVDPRRRQETIRFFERLLTQHPFYENIVAIDPSHNVFARAYGADVKVDVQKAPWYQRSLVTDGLFVSGPGIDKTKDKPIVFFAYPRRDREGKRVGTVGVAMGLLLIQNAFAGTPIPPGAHVALLNAQGKMLARTQDPEKWVGKQTSSPEAVSAMLVQGSGTAEKTSVDGTRVIMGFKAIPGPNWVVLAAYPKSTAYEAVLTDLKVLLLTFIPAFGLTLLLAVGLTRRIARPIRRLTAGAKLLAAGQNPAEVAVASRDETGELAQAFNAMAREIARRVHELSAINAITQATTRSLRLDEVLCVCLKKILEVMALPAGVIHLIDRSGQYLELAAAEGVEPGKRATLLTLKVGEGCAGRAADTQQAAVNCQDADLPLGGNSHLAIPIRFKERLLGVLTLSLSQPLREEDLKLLQDIVGQLAVAVENATLYATVQRHLDQLQRTQIQLFQAERLSALGRLTSGVAHELNNPLAAIVGYSDLLIRRGLPDHDLKENLEIIRQQADRAARIVRKLLAFARADKPERVSTNLNELAEQTVSLLRYQLEVDNITVQTRLDGSIPNLLVDPHQIQQVLLNLITNARQAMAAIGHGTLTLTIRREGGRVVIEVSDTGPGIPPEHLPHVFDPFFTTKEVGDGTGLGLSICHGIVKEHGGEVGARSVPGVETTFTIQLPLVEAPKKAQTVPLVAGPEPNTSGQILVVDDEEAIRSWLSKSLTARGYEVDVAGTGADAQALLTARRYDAIVCDIKMPNGDGQHLYHAVLQRDPTLARRMIFITGDTVNPATKNFLMSHGGHALAKPFSIDELTSALEAVKGDRWPVPSELQGSGR